MPLPDGELLLRGGRVVCPASGTDQVLDLRIVDGRVAERGAALSAGTARVLDCAGLAVLPGFVDLVADLADPGSTWREDLRTGSMGAAAGGFTTVLASPATEPVIDSAAVAAGAVLATRGLPGARVLRAGAVSLGLKGQELAEMGSMLEEGCVALSDGGLAMADAAVMRNALEYARPFGAPVLLRPGLPSLETRGCMHEGHISLEIGLRGLPAASEEVGLELILALVRLTGAKVHCSHITTARAATLLARARADGLPVTGSAPARSLLLTDAWVRDHAYDPAGRLLPPLRPEADRQALVAAVRAGQLGLCSDHQPWTRVDKELEFERAVPGALGLETAFGAALTALDGDLGAAARALAVGPAAVLGRQARLDVGDVADVVVVDPAATLTVGAPRWSRADNEPLRGRSLQGAVVHTLVEGVIVHGG